MKITTVPICDVCWLIEEGERKPVRACVPDIETCYRCKQITHSRIYVRRMIETPTPTERKAP